MSRNISNIVDFVQFLIRKERGVFISPEQTTTNLDAGQLDAFEEYFKLYDQTQRLHDALQPFQIDVVFTSDSGGNVQYPDDYQHLLAKHYTVTGSTVNDITFVQDNELAFALRSQLRPVTDEYPIAIETKDGFCIYPQKVQRGIYSYLKRPATPVYGYTQSGRQITYNPNTSVQLEWNEGYINNIIAKSLRYVGIYMAEQEISQFAEIYNQQTQ